MGVLSILVAGLPLHGVDAAGGLQPGPGLPTPAPQPHPCAALVSPWPPAPAQAFSPQGQHAPPRSFGGQGWGLSSSLGCGMTGGLPAAPVIPLGSPAHCTSAAFTPWHLFPGDGPSGAEAWLSVPSLALPHVYGDGVLRVRHAGDAGQRAREALPRVPGPRVSVRTPLLPPPPPPGHSRVQAPLCAPPCPTVAATEALGPPVLGKLLTAACTAPAG